MRASAFVLGAFAALALTGCDQHQRASLNAVQGIDAASAARDDVPTTSRTDGDIALPASAVGATPAAQASLTHDDESVPVTLPKGMVLAVRLDRSLSTARTRAGNAFHALLDAPLVINGRQVLARGTRFTGHVTTSESAGRLRGRAELAITLDAVDIDGRRYPLATSVNTRRGAAHTRRNLTFIGGGGGLGALVGGWTGGKKGVAIGTAVGAGAGTAAAASIGKQDLEVPAQQLYRFSLERSVRVPS